MRRSSSSGDIGVPGSAAGASGSGAPSTGANGCSQPGLGGFARTFVTASSPGASVSSVALPTGPTAGFRLSILLSFGSPFSRLSISTKIVIRSITACEICLALSGSAAGDWPGLGGWILRRGGRNPFDCRFASARRLPPAGSRRSAGAGLACLGSRRLLGVGLPSSCSSAAFAASACFFCSSACLAASACFCSSASFAASACFCCSSASFAERFAASASFCSSASLAASLPAPRRASLPRPASSLLLRRALCRFGLLLLLLGELRRALCRFSQLLLFGEPCRFFLLLDLALQLLGLLGLGQRCRRSAPSAGPLVSTAGSLSSTASLRATFVAGVVRAARRLGLLLCGFLRCRLLLFAFVLRGHQDQADGGSRGNRRAGAAAASTATPLHLIGRARCRIREHESKRCQRRNQN